MTIKQMFFTTAIMTVVVFNACKDKTTDPPPTVDCSTKSITLALAKTDASKCSIDGTITATATGSTGFTYQLNTGAFQASNVFSNLAAGTYNVTAKDADGCTKTTSVTVGENTTKGPKFSTALSIINTKCQTACHGNGQDGAPTNLFNTECGVVAQKLRIKVRALEDGMGSLNQSQIDAINAWLNAGGRYTD